MEQEQDCADCSRPIEKAMLAVERPGRRCRRCAKAAFDLHFRHALEVMNQTRQQADANRRPRWRERGEASPERRGLLPSS